MHELDPGRAPILASDAERERVVASLREAVGEGRLTLGEFAERVDVAQRARTHTDLAAVTRDLPPSAPAGALDVPAPRHRATFSHLVRTGPWSLPARSSWRTVFGTIDLDLRAARLAGAETEIAVHNVFGTVTVIVPEGIEVDVRGGGPLASHSVEPPSRPPLPGGPRLVIACSGPGGSLQVRTQPTIKAQLKGLIRG